MLFIQFIILLFVGFIVLFFVLLVVMFSLLFVASGLSLGARGSSPCDVWMTLR